MNPCRNFVSSIAISLNDMNFYSCVMWNYLLTLFIFWKKYFPFAKFATFGWILFSIPIIEIPF